MFSWHRQEAGGKNCENSCQEKLPKKDVPSWSSGDQNVAHGANAQAVEKQGRILARPRQPKNLLMMKRKTEMPVYQAAATGHRLGADRFTCRESLPDGEGRAVHDDGETSDDSSLEAASSLGRTKLNRKTMTITRRATAMFS